MLPPIFLSDEILVHVGYDVSVLVFSHKLFSTYEYRFAFQQWHSAVEFRRYLHRFIHEFSRINTLAGVDRTPLNQYESIILPIEVYLKNQGVEFRYG